MARTTKPVDSLLAQLRETLKEELREEVRAELIAELAGGKPLSKPAPAKAAPAKSPLKPTQRGFLVTPVKEGERRTEEDVNTTKMTIRTYLKQNPGSRVDQMAKAMGVPVKDLQLPVAKLLAEKMIAKKGKLRGTTYTASGGKPAAKSKSR